MRHLPLLLALAPQVRRAAISPSALPSYAGAAACGGAVAGEGTAAMRELAEGCAGRSSRGMGALTRWLPQALAAEPAAVRGGERWQHWPMRPRLCDMHGVRCAVQRCDGAGNMSRRTPLRICDWSAETSEQHQQAAQNLHNIHWLLSTCDAFRCTASRPGNTGPGLPCLHLAFQPLTITYPVRSWTRASSHTESADQMARDPGYALQPIETWPQEPRRA